MRQVMERFGQKEVQYLYRVVRQAVERFGQKEVQYLYRVAHTFRARSPTKKKRSWS